MLLCSPYDREATELKLFEGVGCIFALLVIGGVDGILNGGLRT